MYDLEIKPAADKVFSKLAKKDKILLKKIFSKIIEIRENPVKRYKFLKGELKGLNRVHVAEHFVLIFELDHVNKILTIVYFAHHDDAYE